WRRLWCFALSCRQGGRWCQFFLEGISRSRLGGGPLGEPLQRRFRFLRQAGFGGALGEGLQEFARFRGAGVLRPVPREALREAAAGGDRDTVHNLPPPPAEFQ